MAGRGACRVALALVALCVARAACGLLATAQLEQCVDNGSPAAAAAGLRCSERVTVTLTLFGGQRAGSERLEANITAVRRADGSTAQLAAPVVIVYEKSEPLLVYPIVYKQSVNHQPTERVKVTSAPCVDAPDAISPTCGWRADSAGQRVAGSQGYCCRCDASQILKLNDAPTRAGLSCDFEFTWGTFSKSSAHCLAFDELWWDVYEVLPYSSAFDVAVHLYQYAAPGAAPSQQTLRLSPAKLSALSDDRSLSAQLVGNLAPFAAYASFAERYLMVPGRPPTHPLAQGGLANAMFVDKARFDLSGRTCNRIGVSDAAFRAEPRACSSPPGSCLNEQPAALYAADAAKRAARLAPDYLVTGFGDPLLGLAANGSAVRALIMQVGTQFDVSLVTLSFDAASLRFVVNKSPGAITDAYVETFESQSRNGQLVATVTNTGTLLAEYSVGVENCSATIQPVPAKRVALGAGESLVLTYALFATAELGLAQACTVAMYDSQGELVAARRVLFNTTRTNLTRGAQDGAPRQTPAVQRSLPLVGSLSCAKKCPNFFDLWCFLTRNCLGFLVRVLGVAAGALCLCCCCCKACKRGSCLRSLFGACFSCRSRRPDADADAAARVSRRRQKRRLSDMPDKERLPVEMPAINLKIVSPDPRPAPRAPDPPPPLSAIAGVLYAAEVDEALAQPGAFAYFNVARSAPVAGLGARFSLLGTVAALPRPRGDKCVAFTVADFPLQTLETDGADERDEERADDAPRYRPVRPPRPLPRALLLTELTRPEAVRFVSLRPHFVCVNRPLVHE